MNKEFFVNQMIEEKKSSHNDFHKYNDLLFKIVTVSSTVLFGGFFLAIEKDIKLLLVFLPFLVIAIFVLLTFTAYASYIADSTTRIYERGLNQICDYNLHFKSIRLQNSLHDHDQKTGFSKESVAFVLVASIMIGAFYVICAIKGSQWIFNNYGNWYIPYFISLIVLPIVLFICYGLIKKRVDAELKVSEDNINLDILKYKGKVNGSELS